MGQQIGLFILGMGFGLLFTILVQVAGMKYSDWCYQRAKKLKAEKRAAMIASGEMCGDGYEGCNGGPKCPFDHK